MTATIVFLFTGEGLVSDITDQADALKAQGYQITSGIAKKGTPYLIATPEVVKTGINLMEAQA